MRKVFAALAAVLLVAVVLQIFLAGSGAFDTAPKEDAFQPHRALGYLILLFTVLLTLLAALARMPGRLTGLTGLVAGLALLQPVIAATANAVDAGELVFGLHAVVGVIIMALVGMVLRQAGGLSRAPATRSAATSARGS